MEHYKNFKIEPSEIETITTTKGVEYYNVSAGLDIETTSTIYNDGKMAFMYIWMVGIGHNNAVYYGRTSEELVEFLDTISLEFELSHERILPIYIHNFGYEFQFLRHHIEWDNVFSVAERKPIKALTKSGIEFRDSYILSGYSLANTAKNLAFNKVEKMVGDLDYSLIRHQETPLTEKELKYCENDIRVITAYIDEQIQICGNVTKIPLTNTGRVRNYVRNECYYTSKNHKKSGKGKYFRYRKMMKDLTLDLGTYTHLKSSFMGGFTHASNLHSGKTVESVDSIDLTSSYPTVMVSEFFPMSRPKKIEISSLSELEEISKKCCLVFEVKLENVNNKLGYESYISESRCSEISKPIVDNGRIFSAESLTTTITEVDFNIIKNVYSWENIYIKNCLAFVKGRLPKAIVKSILDLYQNKTELKDVEGSEVEYLLSKGMLNSIYGMSVTDILQDEYIYNGEWGKEELDPEQLIKDYNESKNRFLYYPWGVWVTAYARRNVWSAIINVGEDYVYCDTDSVKMFNYDKHKKFIEKYNDWVFNRLIDAVIDLGLDPSQLAPKNKKGIKKPLGIWEHEGHYEKFKTLGAKRYLYKEKESYHLVVAGLSKQNGMNYLIEKNENDCEKIFTSFNDNLFIPANRTGKMTHTYLDNEMQGIVKDYQGNYAKVESKSAIHLEPCEFTLSISKQYSKFLEMLSTGYIYKGLKYI